MRMRWLGGMLIGLAVCCYAMAAQDNQPELEWCLDHLPDRHDYPDDGLPYGPTVDFMQEVARRAGIRLRFSPNTPFARCLRQMERGTTDVMIRLNGSPERERFMYMIPVDYAREEVLLLRKDSPDVKSILELLSLNLIVIRSYTYNADTVKTLATHRKTIKMDSQDSGLQLLLKGRGDALISTVEIARNRIRSNPFYHGQFKFASVSFDLTEPRFVHLGLSRASPHAHLHQRLADAVQSIIADDLINHYFHQLPSGQTQLETQREAQP
ncbi:substrate-binding periplasmic protein [Arsukibacterium indicum]|uniref:Transporter substrate-binding domain-containing protein n=1 Tax=Arsukibacterium indicum TaxID=2848612 RepID=A0ABS6MKI0_9GAMM|nr:transporter substrate-binding domain-containing protein [Arsukibacterium indicum]MBV2129333.1 transporter substrate-binding domain-containing protein [Arsukibacterium indicum]